jgi:murein DD-endopeptidase MepM/ murein hydrolase activator NlpD
LREIKKEMYIGKIMRKIRIAIMGICLLAFLSTPSYPSRASKPFAPPPPATSDIYLIEQAIQQEIEKEETNVLLMMLYDTRVEKIQISADGLWASAWLVPVDPQTGYDVHTEPGLAIVRKIEGVWQAALPSNQEWMPLLQQSPAELITEDARNNLLAEVYQAQSEASTTYSGYKLPWAAGETMALTQSTAHDRYTPSGNAHYSFDFAKPGYPSGMFNVHAAKSAKVKKAVWTYKNGSETIPGNYLLLEDNSTVPTTYQLYLHLAQDSIPLELRTYGAPVQQGQFIGIADDTGMSTGNHLHFMVHAYAYSYWGRSVDITFSDVAINGGRPRILVDQSYCYATDPCSQTQGLYVSGNTITSDTTPPTGEINLPVHNTTINASTVRVEGWAYDHDSGLASIQLKAKFNNEWQPIGPTFSTSTFALDWDLCNSNVPDGPITLALELRDKAGNPTPDLPGLRHFTKNFNCPLPSSPACTPNNDQVALYAEPDFQGACATLGIGSYANAAALGNVSGDNTASIMVGANVQASLFSNDSYLGRAETLLTQDSNLSDNLVGANMVSSLIVQNLSVLPSIPRLVFPANNAQYTQDASFSLSWENTGSSLQFQARLLQNSVEIKNSGWQNQTYWHLNSLPAGNYTWQVRSLNHAGQSNWSAARNLIIQTVSLPPTTAHSVPYFDNLEVLPSIWTHSNYWDLTDEINHTTNGIVSWFYDTNSNGYDTGAPNSGYLTSPAINLPSTQTSYLRFWYYHETENPGLHWDQRWVQISANDGPFTNLYQLSNDIPKNWLSSPALSLEAYAGMTVRIRFYFVTLDSNLNQFKGWYIDDVSITTDPPPNCLDTDNMASTAAPIAYGNTMMGLICAAGDVDYYSFQGTAGDRIGIRVTADSNGSTLDSILSLYDSDGTSLLAENDDIVLYEQPDSFVSYELKRSGTYYARVRSWGHPGSGGYSDYYSLSLNMDRQDPTASLIFPQDGQMLPRGKFQLGVNAADTQTGVSHVEFWWHSPDWQSSDWKFIAQDSDGADGWSTEFDTSKMDIKTNIAIYVRVFDKAGNSTGVGSYNLTLPVIFLPTMIK